mmetsp:Transcript_54687/g.116847  ORF Transcript_54687/g.116847 Transcript_54687/m.116847 type:complete len:118 (-) Transcript_54687:77-430(-)
MNSRKSGVHDLVLGYREQDQLSVAGIHSEGVQTALGLGPLRAMGEIVKTSVTRDYDQLLAFKSMNCSFACICGSHLPHSVSHDFSQGSSRKEGSFWVKAGRKLSLSDSSYKGSPRAW